MRKIVVGLLPLLMVGVLLHFASRPSLAGKVVPMVPTTAPTALVRMVPPFLTEGLVQLPR